MLQKFKRIDFVIVFVLLMLMVVSITSIYSATLDTTGFEKHHIKMAIFYILGFAAFFGLSLIDYRLWNKYALHIYIGGLLTLLLPSFIGQTKNNATGWINLGIVDFQPAELFKLVLIIFITYILIRKNKAKLSFWRDIVPIGLLTFIPFAVVMVQNDLGNGLSYIVILLGLLWIGNVKFSHALIGLLLVAGIAFGGAQAYIHYHDELLETTFNEIEGEGHVSVLPALISPLLRFVNA